MRPREAEAASLGPRAADAVEVVRRSFGHLSERQRDAILAAVRSKMAERRATRVQRGALRWSAISAGALLVCAVAAGALWRRSAQTTVGHAEAISFRVEGGELRTGGSVEAGPADRPVVRFSDGSEVALGEGARAHVRTVDEHGARVTLDEGRAHAYVVHAPATRWSFDVGPFVVDVTGTAFGIAWSVAESRFDLRLENGTVTVSGPVFDAPVALHAGQWLTVRRRDVLIRDLGPGEPGPGRDPLGAAPLGLDRGPAPAPEGPPAPSARTGIEVVPPAEPPSESPPRRVEHHRAAPVARASSHGWASDLAAGRFAAIVDDALRIGLEAAFSGSSGDDLAALADAARYTRQNEVAHGALLALRQRFGASDRARVAAFSLGRLAEAQQDDRAALAWFETYLMEAPSGTYASEALGRKMLLVQHLDGNEAARPLAAAYLLSFPNGTYAQAARALGPVPGP